MASQGPKIPPAAAELIERITWLISLRWLAVTGVVVVVFGAVVVLRLDLAWRPLAAVTLALALYNLLLTLVVSHLRREQAHGPEAQRRAVSRLGPRAALAPVHLLTGWLVVKNLASLIATRLTIRKQRSGIARRKSTLADLLVPRELWGLEREWEVSQAAALASAQISVDLVALAALLHFSGGIENPCVYYFIFHVIISSILLSREATTIQTTLAFGLVSVLALGEYFGVLRHFQLPLLGQSGGYRNPGFVAAQLIVIGSTLYLAAYMASNIAAHQRSYERETARLSDELAEKAERLVAAYRDLHHTERTKSQYMRKVAHELRGPLGTIQTALKVVLQGLVGDLPEPSRDLIIRAERRAGELAQVTHDLLALSRAREGPSQAAAAPVALGEVVAGVMAEMQPVGAQAGVTLHSAITADADVINGDAQGLQQLVGNLVGNAIRYTPREGRVTVRLYRTPGTQWLAVEDTGIGIPSEDLDHVFDEFFRSRNARDFAADGTGLGLAIVKAVAEQHGGRVSITSEPGHGTRVEVALPCGDTAPPDGSPGVSRPG